jgi:hypothetical protein
LLAPSSGRWVIALMMEAARTFETLVNFYKSTRRYNPEDSCLRSHLRENLKSYLVWIIFKNSVRTAKKTQLFTITKINLLTLFKEIIAVYRENHTKQYKMQSHWLLKQVVHVVTIGL